jgi:hypothetical protein
MAKLRTVLVRAREITYQMSGELMFSCGRQGKRLGI